MIRSHAGPTLFWTALAAVFCVLLPPAVLASELYVGGASVSITPDRPVAVTGQMRTRIAHEVETPITATALALESREGDESLDLAVFVACDLVAIPQEVLDEVRRRVAERSPQLDVTRIVISATHTHTAPVMREGIYLLPDEGIMRPAEYVAFLTDRISEAIVSAWESRQPGRVGWGLGHAVVATNRRSVYAEGRAQMYGSTAADDFRGLEGYEDHGVEVLCFWDAEGELLATCINVACPSQEVESRSAINADFWHPVREALKAKHGDELLVLGWTGAAGDQSPHLMFRKAAEERMRTLRGLSRLEEITRRIVDAWEEAYAGARQEQHSDARLIHQVQTLELPLRPVTQAEYVETQAQVAASAADPANQRRTVWLQEVLDRYDRQQAGESKPYLLELHTIRLGDVAIAANPFELFTDFGIQMKARSRALQTFVIQLAGPGTYVPSERAAAGGGYSAIAASNVVGPEGGQALTEATIEALNALWPSE